MITPQSRLRDSFFNSDVRIFSYDYAWAPQDKQNVYKTKSYGFLVLLLIIYVLT